MATEAEAHWFRERLLAWGEENRRDFPWRRTANPYRLLVAECLLQKTTASQVAPVYEELLERYPTVEDLAIADPDDLLELLRPLGLLKRAASLRSAARTVVEKYGGEVPDSEAELLNLPGVGLYAARSVLAHAFGKPVAVLDANVARILGRFFGLEGGRIKSREKALWQLADDIAPETNAGRWNLTLLDFGALTCTARKPKCPDCPLRERCRYANEEPPS
ncbi:A/G-specific adenine glycosylase [Lyngbya sp. CCY1209]|uniref:A/G-specific adenine glycosylase n=1 Tax=Lyngbya sp. CCY1209 TaxID=2886103 RepID=UPI002D20361E|nr:A/G-specific adenine glycosylase [Lyngbya sp. CCY1209]MEB3884087.1 A/G-specific adenine glycosylase [Lyngbya sp. CCY1209]